MMKKLNILMMGAVAMAFVACDEPAPSVPPVQQNPQGPILENTTLDGSAVGAFADNTKVLKLDEYVQNHQVPVVEVGTIEGMPEGGTIIARLQVSADESFSDPKRTFLLDLDMDGNKAYADAYELNEDHVYMFGKAPKPKTVYYRVMGYLNLNGTDYLLGGENHYLAKGTYTEVCMDLGFVIEDHYYFLSNATTWNLAEAEEFIFSHNDDVSVYDDPIFSYVVEVEDDNCYWKIAPQSAIDNADQDNAWDTVLGPEVNGSTDLTGKLVAGEKAQKGRFAEAGKYRITINMEESTYTIKAILFPETLAAPGDGNGWNPANASWIRTHKGEEGKYSEAIFASKTLKFTDSENPWASKVTWGLPKVGGTEGHLADDVDGSDNVPVDGTGAFWAFVNLNDLTYTLTPITSVGIVGNCNGWDIENVIELTPNDDSSVWTADVDFDGGEWKIAINHSWNYNYGGVLEEPWFDAGNFKSTAGVATVTFDLTGNLPVITVIEK